MSTKDIKRQQHDCISRIQSHPKNNNEYETLKRTPRQQLACANQKSINNVQKGKPMTCPTRLLSDAETSGGKHKQKNADNIEIPAKDNNITGGNFIKFRTYSFTNIRFI